MFTYLNENSKPEGWNHFLCFVWVNKQISVFKYMIVKHYNPSIDIALKAVILIIVFKQEKGSSSAIHTDSQTSFLKIME